MAVERGTLDCWSVEQGADGATLFSTFNGPTPTGEFIDFLAALSRLLPETGATLVFDLRGLDGYNPATKEPMKAWLIAHKLAIAEVVVVVKRSETMLKVVTAAVGLAVGVKIRIREEQAGADLVNKLVAL